MGAGFSYGSQAPVSDYAQAVHGDAVARAIVSDEAREFAERG
jgi:hypothetical protein